MTSGGDSHEATMHARTLFEVLLIVITLVGVAFAAMRYWRM